MKGIVTGAVGGFFYVAESDGKQHRCQVRGRIQEQIYPGDRVIVSDNMVEDLIPRDNLLPRPRVANVSVVNIMFSVSEPEMDFQLLDRFLLLVKAADFTPVIYINKLDLNPDFPREEENKIFAYRNAGFRLYIFSVKEETHLSNVKKSFQGGINVMAGPSGVGKSALINKLIPDADLELGEVSNKLKRGRHTTRQVKLLQLPEGGWVADSPGFTSLSLDHLYPGEVQISFPEFTNYQNECHFSSCTHTHEPDCAIKKAVEFGKIPQFRYDSYCNLYKIVEEEGGPEYD